MARTSNNTLMKPSSLVVTEAMDVTNGSDGVGGKFLEAAAKKYGHGAQMLCPTSLLVRRDTPLQRFFIAHHSYAPSSCTPT